MIPLHRFALGALLGALLPASAFAAASGVDVANMDTTCAPCRDFYRYANGTWSTPPRFRPPTLDRRRPRDVRPQPGGAAPRARDGREAGTDREGPDAAQARQPLRGADGLGARRSRGRRSRSAAISMTHRRHSRRQADLRARVRATLALRGINAPFAFQPEADPKQSTHERSPSSARADSGCPSATTTSAPIPSPTRCGATTSTPSGRMFLLARARRRRRRSPTPTR